MQTFQVGGRGRSCSAWGSYKSQWRKPRLSIPGFGCTVMALSDWTCRLRNHECYIISGGKCLLGKVVVWRCPTQCPWDLEVWTGAPLPKDFGPIPFDVVMILQHGYGNSRLAGGGQDGDWHPDLLRIVGATDEALGSVSLEAMGISTNWDSLSWLSLS